MTPPEPLRGKALEDQARPLDRGFVVTIVVVTAVVIFLYMVRQILLPFVAAGMLAIVFTPLVEWSAKRLHAPRALMAVLVFAVLAGFAITLALLVAPPVAVRIGATVAGLPAILQSLVARVMGARTIVVSGQTMGASQVSAAIAAQLARLGQSSGLASLAGAGVAAGFDFVLSWILLFYFLLSGPRIAEGLAWLVPPPHRELAREVRSRFIRVLRRYFIGIGLVVIYASVAAYVGLGLVLKLHGAVLLAIMTGLLEIIPVAGPISSAIIAGVAAAGEATSGAAILAYLAYAILLRLSIDQIFGPLVLGGAARLHPTLVIFCFVSGALLFGVTGVILAVPIALAVKVTLSTIYGEAEDEHPPAQALRGKA